MSSWIDVAGSFIIGAIVILILVNLNIYINSSSAENLFSNVVQESLSTTSDIIEHDFYKMGYGIDGNRIIQADSNSIKFYADLNNTGVDDTVYYHLSNAAALKSTKNPNDKILYRDVNNNTNKSEGAVTDFKLTYYDSLGNQLNYASLSSSTIRSRIRTINIYLKIESADPVNGVYQAAEWERRIFPKNYK